MAKNKFDVIQDTPGGKPPEPPLTFHPEGFTPGVQKLQTLVTQRGFWGAVDEIGGGAWKGVEVLWRATPKFVRDWVWRDPNAEIQNQNWAENIKTIPIPPGSTKLETAFSGTRHSTGRQETWAEKAAIQPLPTRESPKNVPPNWEQIGENAFRAKGVHGDKWKTVVMKDAGGNWIKVTAPVERSKPVKRFGLVKWGD